MKELVVLVHGFFSSQKSMHYLEEHLPRQDFEIVSVNLPSTFGSLGDCVKAFNSAVSPLLGDYSRIHFVGHSLGGLVIRKYLGLIRIPNLGHCIFIATPHHGTRIANILNRVPFFSRIIRPIPGLMTHKAYPNCHFGIHTRIGIIAGTRNGLLAGKLFLSRQSDGRVELESARCVEPHELITLPFHHKVIHKQAVVAAQVEAFLKNGRFIPQQAS
jgi:uncharacterized alpha/beta hydrolase family protein